MFWALCKRCKNNLLEVYFKDDAIGARCGGCKIKVFELSDVSLEDVKRSESKRGLQDRLQPFGVKKVKPKKRILN
jgi:hypothetical protein